MEHLTSDSFKEKVEQASGLVVVDFYADWCGPCKRLAPTFQSVSEKVKNANFYKINVEEAGDLAAQFGVRSIPTLIFFKDGKEADRIMGAMDEEELEQAVLDHAGSDMKQAA